MNPLDQLQDITLPAPVTAFPWAWGWWLLIVIAIAAVIGCGYWFKQRQQRNRFVKLAQHQLAQLDSNASDYGARTQQLLKQTLMAYHSREQIASLHDNDWHQLLNQYHNADWAELIGNPYRPNANHGGAALTQAAQQALAKMAQPRIKPQTEEANHA